jgi:hypothetical protein
MTVPGNEGKEVTDRYSRRQVSGERQTLPDEDKTAEPACFMPPVGTRWNPRLDGLRSDPRFANLLRRMNLMLPGFRSLCTTSRR